MTWSTSFGKFLLIAGPAEGEGERDLTVRYLLWSRLPRESPTHRVASPA